VTIEYLKKAEKTAATGEEAFSELLQGSCPAPKIVLQTG
jgi:hypothetical protein